MLYFCVHPLHMSPFTLALCCCIFLCVSVSSNSFPKCCSETSAHAHWCAWLARWSPSKNALGFSFGFTKSGETTVWSAALTDEWNRHLCPEVSGVLMWLWSVTTTAVQNRLSDLVELISRVYLCGCDRRLWNRRLKQPMFPCSLRINSAVEFVVSKPPN